MSLHSAPRRADGEPDDFDDDVEPVEAPDDPGELDPGTRRLLLKLLNGPYVRAEEHAKLWAALERNEPVVRSRLADLSMRRRESGFLRSIATRFAIWSMVRPSGAAQERHCLP